jgi:hypothetical protein
MTRGERAHPGIARQETSLHDRLAQVSLTGELEDGRSVEWKQEQIVKNTKFLVKVNRAGARSPEYVQRIDRIPIQTTSNRKLAMMMGRFTAEDVVRSIQTSRCNPELVSVEVQT